jgi:hypothetical protein
MVQLEIEIVIVHKESELILAIPSVIQCRTIPTWHSNYPRDNIYIYEDAIPLLENPELRTDTRS